EVIVNPLDKSVTTFPIFVGPKEYDLLSSYKFELEESIEFGIFSFLSIPMLQILNFTYDYVGNYGLAIIVLTFVIKIITYPLTQKSMTSMKKMQVLQPEMTKIREKFKGEPQKRNAAMMELYKKHGANPMGGCLPMVIQIPIFIALYKTLLVSIELKGSPFIFWITDLSQKDPYFITPILMGLSMFLQQRMTPTGGDPTQQKIFMFLPLVFTFIFLNFPAGLVIYWLTNNVLTIIQQYFINRKVSAK
ncbi:MAG TPA: preprotein translocase YidC, partial [Flexistipes sinusarabici]|nr:preprotein translocase YidC [Flexistipes sinusarabici]